MRSPFAANASASMTAHAAAVLRSLDFLANQSHEHADRMRDYMLGVRLIGRGFADAEVVSRAAAFGAVVCVGALAAVAMVAVVAAALAACVLL